MPNKARYFSTYASDVNANGPTAASMSGHSGFAVPICPMNSATLYHFNSSMTVLSSPWTLGSGSSLSER